MPSAHANWSPSGFKQVVLCPGSKAMQAGLEGSSSFYAAEGTCAHDHVLTPILKGEAAPEFLVGTAREIDDLFVEITDEMVEAVSVCVGYVHALMELPDAMLLVDRRVNFSQSLGVPEDEGWGTLDVAVLLPDELVVLDYKHGRGVEVSAEWNEQMMLYAIGIIDELHRLDLDVPENVRLVISQPRVSRAPSEWRTTVSEIGQWVMTRARSAVISAQNAVRLQGEIEQAEWEATFLKPGESQCKFCKAKATCPALRDAVATTVDPGADAPASPEEFADLEAPKAAGYPAEWLAACLSKVDLIEDWCTAVRAEAKRRLEAGEPVPGYKLVQGKRGNRQWSDKAAVEKLLREKFRLPLEKAFDLSLISPTTAEKLAKAGDIGPRQWAQAQALIVQRDGAPHVAPASDPRPALDIKPVADEFADVSSINDLV